MTTIKAHGSDGEEVESRERNHIDCEFSKVGIELTRELKRLDLKSAKVSSRRSSRLHVLEGK